MYFPILDVKRAQKSQFKNCNSFLPEFLHSAAFCLVQLAPTIRSRLIMSTEEETFITNSILISQDLIYISWAIKVQISRTFSKTRGQDQLATKSMGLLNLIKFPKKLIEQNYYFSSVFMADSHLIA